MNIDWVSESSHVLLNDRMPSHEKEKWNGVLTKNPILKGHIWLCTSGTHRAKLVALSKKSILLSAVHVNEALESSSSDKWLCCLPTFHVGGLGIYARAYLSGAEVTQHGEKWNPLNFYQVLCSSQSTLVSLVPTQLYDIVKANLLAPKSLRAVIVGGAALSDMLFKQAEELGWNLLPTYGMTEAASQIALADIRTKKKGVYPTLKMLRHMSGKVDADGYLCFKGDSLLTGYSDGLNFIDPKDEAGYFKTEDKGELVGNELRVWGRGSDFVKVGGELVSILKLQGILDSILVSMKCEGDFAIVAVPDGRLGHVIQLATTQHCDLGPVLQTYHAQTLPFEKIREVVVVKEIPRTPLGKIRSSEILEL